MACWSFPESPRARWSFTLTVAPTQSSAPSIPTVTRPFGASRTTALNSGGSRILRARPSIPPSRREVRLSPSRVLPPRGPPLRRGRLSCGGSAPTERMHAAWPARSTSASTTSAGSMPRRSVRRWSYQGRLAWPTPAPTSSWPVSTALPRGGSPTVRIPTRSSPRCRPTARRSPSTAGLVEIQDEISLPLIALWPAGSRSLVMERIRQRMIDPPDGYPDRTRFRGEGKDA